MMSLFAMPKLCHIFFCRKKVSILRDLVSFFAKTNLLAIQFYRSMQWQCPHLTFWIILEQRLKLTTIILFATVTRLIGKNVLLSSCPFVPLSLCPTVLLMSLLFRFIAAMTHEFDRDVIANGGGSLQFLQYLWDTAGNCVTCSLRQCDVTQERFHDFARNALIIHKNELKCSSSGMFFLIISHSKCELWTGVTV